MNVPMGKFKAGMSRYIRAAHAGKDVVVTSRGKAVVRLVPVVEEQLIAPPSEAERDKRLAELRAKLKAAMPGVRIGKGRFSLGSFQPVKPKPGTKTMSETVIEDRR
jgi:prevent-host-death family protein